MAHMNPSGTKVRKSALLFMVVGLSVLSASTLAGQGPFAPASGAMDLVLQKLDAILAAVAAPPPPEPSEVTLRTSPVLSQPVGLGATAYMACNITNASERNMEVEITLRLSNGTPEIGPITVAVAPGRASFLARHLTGTALYHCEFKFTGFADELRANISATNDGIDLPSVVLEAR